MRTYKYEVTVSAAQAFTQNQACDFVTLIARASNSGIIYVGGDIEQEIDLRAGDSVDLKQTGLTHIYAYGTVAGDVLVGIPQRYTA